jgi:hypothetical protein
MIRGRVVLYLAVVLLALAQAGAAPLDADTCAKLKVEQTQLEDAGAGRNMAKGPQWAKANLAPDKIEQVRRLIELEELLLFRCTGRSLVTLPPEADPDPAAASTEPGEDGKDAPDAAANAGKKAAVPAAAGHSDHPKNAPPAAKAPGPPAKGQNPKARQKGPEEASGAAGKHAKQEGAKHRANAKAAAKAKADDAFKPQPSPDPAADPFAGKQAPPGKQ